MNVLVCDVNEVYRDLKHVLVVSMWTYELFLFAIIENVFLFSSQVLNQLYNFMTYRYIQIV